MSDVKKEIEMELKPYETMCEQTTEHLKTLITGSIEATPDEIKAVACTLGEIIDIKKDIVEMCYKKTLIEAMEENKDSYGEEWDENGLRNYGGRRRSARTGRFIRGYDEPMMYDNNNTMEYHDRVYDPRMDDIRSGRMYSTVPGPVNGRVESEYDRTRRMYEESKAVNPDNKSDHMNKLNKHIQAIEQDFMRDKGSMSTEEMNIASQQLMKLAEKMKNV